MMSAPWRPATIVAACCLAIPLALAEVPRPDTFEFSAFTVPAKEIEIASARGGVIDKVAFEEGATVAAGDPLVYLASAIESAQVAVAEARVKAAQAEIDDSIAIMNLAEKEYERGKDLREEGGSISDSELDELQLQVNRATTKLQLARDNKRINELSADYARAILEQMTVTTPIDGEILLIHKHEGEAIEEHAPLMKLVNVDTLHVITFASLAAVERIKPGMKATFCFTLKEGGPLESIPCTVFLIDAVADAASGLCRVKASIDNKRIRHRPGVRGAFRVDIPDRP